MKIKQKYVNGIQVLGVALTEAGLIQTSSTSWWHTISQWSLIIGAPLIFIFGVLVLISGE